MTASTQNIHKAVFLDTGYPCDTSTVHQIRAFYSYKKIANKQSVWVRLMLTVFHPTGDEQLSACCRTASSSSSSRRGRVGVSGAVVIRVIVIRHTWDGRVSVDSASRTTAWTTSPTCTPRRSGSGRGSDAAAASIRIGRR